MKNSKGVNDNNNNNNNNNKAYDMVPQSWIINCLKMYKISHEVINFIEKTMQTWIVELTAGGKSLAEQRSKEVFSKEMHYHPYYS